MSDTAAITFEERMARLLASDPELAAATPLSLVSAALDQPGLGLVGLVRTVMEGYADRPAVGQRTISFAADSRTGRRAIRLEDRFDTISYAGLWRRVNAVASGLGAELVASDHRVCILGFASVDYTTLDLALALLGAVSVPLQSGAPVDQLRPIIAETLPSVIACDVENLATATKLALDADHELKIVVLDYHPQVDDHRDAYTEALEKLAEAGRRPALESLADVIDRGNTPPPVRSIVSGDDDPMRLLIYTSGSTGAPKGAMFPERLVANLWRAVPGAVPLITLNYYPMSHLAGRITLYGTLANGGTAYFTARSDLSALLDDLAMVRPTQLSFVPRVWDMLAQQFQRELDRRAAASEDIDRLKSELLAEQREHVLGGRFLVASCGSAPLSPELKEFVEALLDMPVRVGYGSTETAGAIAMDGHLACPPITDYKLVEVPELGYHLTDQPHPRGELLVKSDHLFAGYYKRPEVTASVFDPDGFYRTGDIVAEIGPNEIAYLDRRNNVLKLSQGEFVTISKLEAVFGASPHIRQIYLYGNSTQAYLLAVVVPSEELLSDRGPEQPPLKAVINEALQSAAASAGLQSYEIPRDFLIESTPFALDNGLLTGIGKLARPKLTERYGAKLERLYADHAHGQAKQLRLLREQGADEPVPATVTRAAGAVLGVASDELSPGSHFTDLGGDSLSALTLANLLQEIYGIDIPVSVIVSPANDLQRLADFIEDAGQQNMRGSIFTTVHGIAPVEVHARDLTLDKFIDDELLRAAGSLPEPTGQVQTVLLTGATGFLGRFLLLEWLERLSLVNGKLICLVRAKDPAAAWERLSKGFDTGDSGLFRRYHELAARHLEVVVADKGQPALGLDGATWQRLADTVDVIVDPAALVNHVLPYRQLFDANVVGTAELIRIALAGRLKPFVYVSTAGVGAGLDPSDFDEDRDVRMAVPRRTLDDGYANGYVTSKWAAEVLLREANEQFDLPVSVFRCDMILADADHVGQLNVPDMFTRLILSVVATGIAPHSFYELDEDGSRARAHFDGLPVDFIAQAICALSDLKTGEFHAYHVVNPHDDGIGLDTYVDWLIAAGLPITRIHSYEKWLKRFGTALRALPERQRRNSILPLIHSYERPQQPLQKSLVTADRFRGSVQEKKIGSDNDIPHVTPEIIANYVASLRSMDLL
ncbi:oxidoreductase [Mycobacterium colombiense]|uniref:carboxylic acid reductase n=1 Tax=Mycobacterium colombiense TaxID=339268 RepID=UPI0007EF1D5F|nr:carboxylic acid reductase [Mycobacterium colombiense]OBK68931.1 oxidoreductase [Mycobacterium colombiense]